MRELLRLGLVMRVTFGTNGANLTSKSAGVARCRSGRRTVKNAPRHGRQAKNQRAKPPSAMAREIGFRPAQSPHFFWLRAAFMAAYFTSNSM